MQISEYKASILISLRELCESEESSAVAHQWSLLQAQLVVLLNLLIIVWVIAKDQVVRFRPQHIIFLYSIL